MWKKSIACLVALALVVSSLSAYPAFFYGKAKEAKAEETQEALVPELQEQTLSKETTKSNPDSTPSEEIVMTEDLASSSEPWNDTKSIVDLLEEAKVKKSVIEKVKEACALIDEGRAEMVTAYNAELQYHIDTEAKLGKPRYSVLPLATYAYKTQTWGTGLALGVEWKNIALQVQALKPITKGWESFKEWDDLTVVTGLGVYF